MNPTVLTPGTLKLWLACRQLHPGISAARWVEIIQGNSKHKSTPVIERSAKHSKLRRNNSRLWQYSGKYGLLYLEMGTAVRWEREQASAAAREGKLQVNRMFGHAGRRNGMEQEAGSKTSGIDIILKRPGAAGAAGRKGPMSITEFIVVER
jgi:hypothetical protein